MYTTLLTIGLACVICAIVGGGLKAAEIEFPILQSTRRQIILACFGLLLSAIAIAHDPPDLLKAKATANYGAEKSTTDPATAKRVVKISGVVLDQDNNAVSDADCFVIGQDQHSVTDRFGSFELQVTGVNDDRPVTVRVSKSGYQAQMQNVRVPSYGLVVGLTRSDDRKSAAKVDEVHDTAPLPASGRAAKPTSGVSRKTLVLQAPNAMKGPNQSGSAAINKDCPEVTVMDYSKFPPESKIERLCSP
jgi:hypothetical protein